MNGVGSVQQLEWRPINGQIAKVPWRVAPNERREKVYQARFREPGLLFGFNPWSPVIAARSDENSDCAVANTRVSEHGTPNTEHETQTSVRSLSGPSNLKANTSTERSASLFFLGFIIAAEWRVLLRARFTHVRLRHRNLHSET
jgi:hypothetical protein